MRAPTMNDLEAVVKLYNTVEIELDGKIETTLDELRVEWSLPSFNLTTDAWLIESPEGRLAAVADEGHQKHVRIYAGGQVHPDYRGLGIGTYLVHLEEERARLHVPEAPEGARVVLSSGRDSRDEAGQHLLLNEGYRHVRSFWRMKITMNEAPPQPIWPEGITLHTFEPGMERAVFEADEEAFKDHWGHIPMDFEEWQHWSVKRENFDPSLWFLPMDGPEIAAIALCQDEKTSGGWVHVLGVRRPWRRKGLGLALLHQAFGEFYRRGIREVYLGVDSQNLTGATRLYERAGMHVYRQYNRYEKELRAGKEVSTQAIEV